MADASQPINDDAALKKSVGLFGLIFYGTGTILGAGIFVVIGEVIGEARALSPFAYLLAGLVAITTALSFAELGARIPTAAGAIDYVDRAFEKRWLAVLTGWVLIVANIVSGATITTGFVSYLSSFADVPNWMATVGLVALLGIVSISGMKQSAWFMTTTTLIGMVTLLAVLWATRTDLLSAPGVVLEAGGSLDGAGFSGLFAGAFLAIYAFIGFGDLAQTAEEAKNPEKDLPRAIVIVMLIVFAFYLLVSAALVGGDMDEVAGAQAPLVRAVEQHGWLGLPIAIASLFVIVNGALTQVIAASRLLLDLGRDKGGAPALFGRVSSRTNTPVIATVVCLAIILALALFLPLKQLAGATSLAILIVFVGVNAALWQLKRRSQPEGVPNIWKIVPVLGFVFCLGAAAGQIWLWVTGG
jgi:amino acid transporter